MDDWTERRQWRSIAAILPGTVLVIFWIGQNDCDHEQKNMGTRPEPDRFDKFRQKIKDQLDKKEQYFEEAVNAGKCQVWWISPCDDPRFEFTAQYTQLVNILREEINKRSHHLQVPGLELQEYEDDHYHLLPESRMEAARVLAERIQELINGLSQ